ncbi:MAG: YraN family protein [Actinomycetota bacterium]
MAIQNLPQNKSKNKYIGAFGEKVIADFLQSRGVSIVERNWRVKEGEIDIVAQLPNGIFAFVEVKTRSSLAFGHPLESISNDKAHRLQRLALAWLATHRAFGAEFQIDCAAVLIANDGQHTIEYRANIL